MDPRSDVWLDRFNELERKVEDCMFLQRRLEGWFRFLGALLVFMAAVQIFFNQSVSSRLLGH